jgi:hypothetical protein
VFRSRTVMRGSIPGPCEGREIQAGFIIVARGNVKMDTLISLRGSKSTVDFLGFGWMEGAKRGCYEVSSWTLASCH